VKSLTATEFIRTFKQNPGDNASDTTVPPDGDVHVIMENCGTHKVPKVARWFARHPRY